MSHIPYPAWWTAAAADRKVLLDSAVAKLRRKLPQCRGVSGALIFGSYARNELGPESDLDLIVIQETLHPIVERGVAMRRLLAPVLDVAFDLIVYTPDEYHQLLTHSSFVQQARQEGLWIDARTPC